MYEPSFSNKAWEEYLEWLTIDRRIFNKINELIKDIRRNGAMSGIGKPEILKHIKAYSRRIDEYHRLIYRFDENQYLRIISCKGHYDE